LSAASRQALGHQTFWLPLYPPGLALMLMALYPTDEHLIRPLALFFVLLLVGLAYEVAARSVTGFTRLAVDQDWKGPTELLLKAVNRVLTLAAVTPVLRVSARSRCPPFWVVAPRKVLQQLWTALRIFAIGEISITAIRIAFEATGWSAVDAPASIVAHSFRILSFLLCVAMASTRIRGHVIRFLSTFRAKGSNTAEQEAAALSALIAHHDAASTLKLAVSRFRVLPLDRLVEADLSDGRNRGGEDTRKLHSRTEPAALGECDAFMSHSWSEDAGCKWRVLQEWRQRFVAEHHREPRIWLDKACLDQADVTANLRCLPIFLAACSSLVVVFGDTYASRLWCCMELFIYLKISGDQDRVEVLPTSPASAADPNPPVATHSTSSRAYSHPRIDIAKAQCFDPRDRQHLLAVIETGFGDAALFNKRVEDLFAYCLDPSRSMPARSRADVLPQSSIPNPKADRSSDPATNPLS